MRPNKKTSIKKVLLTILGLLFFINFFLLGYYFFKAQKNPQQLFKINRDFTGNTNDFYLAPGEIRIIEGSNNDGIITTLMLKGKITNKPYYDKNSKAWTVPINFKSKNSTISTKVIIGFNDSDIITVLKAKKGKIIAPTDWNGTKIIDTLTLFKSKDPIILWLYYQKDLNNIKQNSRCNNECKQRLIKIEGLYKSNKDLVDKIKNDQVENDLLVGPIDSMILYVN